MNENTPCDGPPELAQANCGDLWRPATMEPVPAGQPYQMGPVPDGEHGDFGPLPWEPGKGRHRKAKGWVSRFLTQNFPPPSMWGWPS